MMSPPDPTLAHRVRLFIYREAAVTAGVPQAPEIARALDCPEEDVRQAIRSLGAGRALILAPNDGQIWAASPFCAVPSDFRVEARGLTYWGICVWEALGIPALLSCDARVHSKCAHCAAPMTLAIAGGTLAGSRGVAHFAVPARRFWDNVAYT